MKKNNIFQRGFTLVEIIVVMAIMGITLVVGTTAYTNQARERQMKQDAEKIVNEIQSMKQNVLARNVQSDTSCNLQGYFLTSLAGSSNYTINRRCNIPPFSYNGLHHSGTLVHTYFDSASDVSIHILYPYAVANEDYEIILRYKYSNRCMRINVQKYQSVVLSDPYDC